jgi:hypothetical protein
LLEHNHLSKLKMRFNYAKPFFEGQGLLGFKLQFAGRFSRKQRVSFL